VSANRLNSILRNAVGTTGDAIQSLQLALGELMRIADVDWPRSESLFMGTSFYRGEDQQAIFARFQQLLGPGKTSADFENVLCIIAGVHGGIAMPQYQHGTGYACSFVTPFLIDLCRDLCMAFSLVLPTQHAVRAILTLYEAFGVGHANSLQQRCAAAQLHLQQSLGADAAQLPDNWLYIASAEVCEHLFWSPGRPLKQAVSVWTRLVLQEDSMAAFFALLLALVEPCKYLFLTL
jgi:hypothetical protein